MHTWSCALAASALLACSTDVFNGSDATTDDGGDATAGGDAISSEAAVSCPFVAGLRCGDAGPCAFDGVCCVSASSVQCKSAGGCSDQALSCLGSADCIGDGGLMACCLFNSTAALGCPIALTSGVTQCVSQGTCSSGVKLCRTDGDCGGSTKTCKRAAFLINTSYEIGVCE